MNSDLLQLFYNLISSSFYLQIIERGWTRNVQNCFLFCGCSIRNWTQNNLSNNLMSQLPFPNRPYIWQSDLHLFSIIFYGFHRIDFWQSEWISIILALFWAAAKKCPYTFQTDFNLLLKSYFLIHLKLKLYWLGFKFRLIWKLFKFQNWITENQIRTKFKVRFKNWKPYFKLVISK